MAVLAKDFVGREMQLSQVLDLLDQAGEGRGRLALIHGEAGVGKTRFLDELSRRAERLQVEVHRANCWQGEGAPAFWPWIQLLRSYLAKRDPVAAAVELGVEGSEIARLLPGADDHLRESPETLLAMSDQARFLLFDAVAGFLLRASSSRPLMLIIDDLHWSDQASVLLLSFLAPQLHDSRLTVVASYRHAQPFADALSRLPSDSARIQLTGLSLQEVARLASIQGADPDQRFISALHEKTGGNPLFVIEFVQLAMARSTAALEGLGLPPGIRGVLEQKVHSLTPECRRLFEIVSVLGRDFEAHGFLDEFAGTPYARIDSLIGQAVRAGVISEDHQIPGRFSFSHALIRDVFYEALSSDEREQMHRRAGAFIEQLEIDRLDERLTELALHFHRAGGESAPKAMEYAERAGSRAFEMLAYEEAARYFSQALESLSRASSGDEKVELRLLLELGKAQSLVGDTDQSRRSFLEAAQLARRLGDNDSLASAALGFGRRLQFAGIAGTDAELRRLLEEALLAMGDENSATKVLLLCRLAYELGYSDRDRSEQLLEQVLELLPHIKDERARVAALQRVQLSKVGGGDPRERLELSRELIRTAEEAGDSEHAIEGRISQMIDLVELGDFAQARKEMDEFARQVESTRLKTYLWYQALWKAMLAIVEGRLAEASDIAASALEAGSAWGRIAFDHFGLQTFAMAWEQGNLGSLIPAMVDAVQSYPSVPAYRCALALSYAESGKEVSARAEFAQIASDGFVGLQRDYNWLISLALAAEACALVGEPDEADALYGLLLPHEASFVWAGYATICYGSTHRFLGKVATRAGRLGDAKSHFEISLAQNARIGAGPAMARTRYDYALACLASGDMARASELLDQAVEAARELGLSSIETKALALQQQLAGGAANVFRREGDYWTLAFEGKELKLRDSKGLRDIAYLLRSPDREFHVADLIASSEGGSPSEGMDTRGLIREGKGAPVIDATARDNYRARLEELQDQLEDAEHNQDQARGANARAEMDFIASHLASALGIGGRERRAGDPSERARKAVTERIRNAIKRIEREHRGLAKHLEIAVRTGTFCSYSPEKPVSWDL